MDGFWFLAKWATRLCVLTWIATFYFMQRLPPPEKVSSYLYLEPRQHLSMGTRETKIIYKNQEYPVRIIADYELNGLVVSHNDPFRWYRFDITHDEYSLDTRDLCVIWGSNVRSDHYRHVSYHNEDYQCVIRWSAGQRGIDLNKLSNNHLITDSDAVRKVIANILVGDQVYMRGFLVNYSEPDWGSSWRISSISREDEGDGACEVFFVKEIRVLATYNYWWAQINRGALWGFIILIALRVMSSFFVKRGAMYRKR